jgi:hypothetical protein
MDEKRDEKFWMQWELVLKDYGSRAQKRVPEADE